ncbi:hypothetical protein OG417_28160 [Actinoallomurus sp. NBC_01490]|uniref:hypothetical protein n=1 Tax=Actinoallomurus sp. NBC_01490 TaxID=2903557 RepID=UPI002E30CCD8|nr:hypothetical protein [Actinoallomurus sp. NBC_01490]
MALRRDRRRIVVASATLSAGALVFFAAEASPASAATGTATASVGACRLGKRLCGLLGAGKGIAAKPPKSSAGPSSRHSPEPAAEHKHKHKHKPKSANRPAPRSHHHGTVSHLMNLPTPPANASPAAPTPPAEPNPDVSRPPTDTSPDIPAPPADPVPDQPTPPADTNPGVSAPTAGPIPHVPPPPANVRPGVSAPKSSAAAALPDVPDRDPAVAPGSTANPQAERLAAEPALLVAESAPDGEPLPPLLVATASGLIGALAALNLSLLFRRAVAEEGCRRRRAGGPATRRG